jgi:PTH1 family peptidyl-tRNA hydrolase
MAEVPWLVVGLGNPGERYARNRHNVGAMVLDRLAGELGARFGAHRSRAAVAETRLPPHGGTPGERVLLAKPTTYMNVSGGQVAGLVRYYGVAVDRLLVVHDELDLPFGTLRLKLGGGEGGHNGLRSVSQSLGEREYARLRFGIGRPPGRTDPADFVLKDFSGAERVDLALLVAEAAEAALDVVRDGLDRTQTRVNALP